MFDEAQFDNDTNDIERLVRKWILASCAAVLLVFAISAALGTAIVWVAYHFISKVW
jgi:hypothetical protein